MVKINIIRKWAGDEHRHFTEKIRVDIQGANNTLKDIIYHKPLKLKSQRDYNTPIRKTKIKTVVTAPILTRM